MQYLFLTFLAAALTVNAAPNIGGGYHYERNNIGQTSSKDISTLYGAPPTNTNSLSITAQALPQTSSPGYSYSGEKYLPPTTPTLPPIITKQFYLVSAPEEMEEEIRTKHLVLGRPQKNYRVVFIKAPSTQNTNVRLTAEYAPQEEKTVIYVLSKKPNEIDIGEVATPAPPPPTKPEVFFIKYKTPEEALAAQKEIQEQYDHLGGTSEFSDEGTVPIKSVIGSLDGGAANGGYDYKKVQNGANSAIKDFLSPMRFFF